jgi:hypothetical protein
VYAARVVAVILLAFGLFLLAGLSRMPAPPVQVPVFFWVCVVLFGPYFVLVWVLGWPQAEAKTFAMSVALSVGMVATFFAVSGEAWSTLDTANQWEFKDRHLLNDIKYTHRLMEGFHEEEGRYPREVSEDAFIDRRVDRIKQYCQGRGIEVAEVRLLGDEAGEEGERRELLIATDAEGKTLVVIYSDGTFGVSRRLLTRRAYRGPKEMEILR